MIDQISGNLTAKNTADSKRVETFQYGKASDTADIISRPNIFRLLSIFGLLQLN